jgi:hypothetical protein
MNRFTSNAIASLKRGALGCALAALAGGAQADAFTLSGNFSSDDQVALFTVTLDSAGTMLARSLGYAGGVDTLGVSHAAGGFDTMLFLFNAAGVLVAQSDDGVNVPADPATGLAADAAFSIALGAGSYTLVLTQYDNFPLGNLGTGFSQAGSGNFTPTLSSGCTATAFCDWSGAARTSAWVLAVEGVSAVPEPASALTLLAGGLALLAWRRRASQTLV